MLDTNENNTGPNLDIVSALAYDSHKEYWETYMIKAIQLHIKFWSLLTDELCELGTLAELGLNINTTLALVEEHWDRMQRYKQKNSLKVVRQYANFMKQVLNDKEGCKELLKNVNEDKDEGEEAFEFDKNGQLLGLGKFTEGGYSVIVASGRGEPGKISLVSMGIPSLFGYSKAELLKKDIDILMPKLLAQKHKKLIKESVEKQDDKKEKIVWAKHKTGYVFTVEKQIKAFPSISNNWQFIVRLRKDKKKADMHSAVVFFDKDLIIQDLSFRIYNLFLFS